MKNIPNMGYLRHLAWDAGSIMQKHFPNPGQVIAQLKADQTPVTEADLAISQMVNERTKKQYPHVAVVCEERPVEKRAEVELIVDELDGTAAYANGVPTAVFAAAVSSGGLVHAIIHDPLCFGVRRTYSATKGQGAEYVGGTGGVGTTSSRLAVSRKGVADHPTIAIATSFGDKGRMPVQNMMLIADELQRHGCNIQGVNSISYSNALLAAGRIEGILFPWGTLHDIAPGDLIVTEAGGKTSNLRGEQLFYGADRLDGAIFANGPQMHEFLLEIVAKYY